MPVLRLEHREFLSSRAEGLGKFEIGRVLWDPQLSLHVRLGFKK